VIFLNRHGVGHRYSPSTVPYRANIYALKAQGVTSIIASGATGSLREDMVPGDLVICDQVIDKTCRRDSTFFDGALVAHVEMAEPFCPRLRGHLQAAGMTLGTRVHAAGTYVCMEGPQFSTRAESLMHRAWGGDLIGMTCMPEAKLAREAEICYAVVAFPTDYDCWHPLPAGADRNELLREILLHLKQASENALKLISATVERLAATSDASCPCTQALQLAIWTRKEEVADDELRRLGPLVRKYFEGRAC
jgi:5'-methylthioadenosine phosphorylase